MRALVRERSSLPVDSERTSITVETIVTMFQLFLRPNERLLCYADKTYASGSGEGLERDAVDLVALTTRRLARARIEADRLRWKEVPATTSIALGLTAQIGHPEGSVSKWWIEDVPTPPSFYIDLPPGLLDEEDDGPRWEWTTAETTMARMSIATLDAWSDATRRGEPTG